MLLNYEHNKSEYSQCTFSPRSSGTFLIIFPVYVYDADKYSQVAV